MIKVGVIGTGYWGKHHLRIFSQLPCKLVGIAELNPAMESMAKQYGVEFYTDFRQLLEKVDAVSIVTPPSTHFSIAKEIVAKGKHALLEKPFVMKSQEAKELEACAQDKNIVLMSGHTYLYQPSIVHLKTMIEKKEFGALYYGVLQWLNLGIIRKDVDALWNFGPHPFSILYYLLGEMPKKISCTGRSVIQQGIADAVFVLLTYESGVTFAVNLSWLHPLKVREVTLVGSKKLAYFNDVAMQDQLRIFDKGITPEEYKQAVTWENFAQFKLKSSVGNEEIPTLTEVEPLKEELLDFIYSIEQGKKPKADGQNAASVVTMLEAAQKSMESGGASIELS